MADRNTKMILDTKELTDGFFDETRLLGIMAPVKDYQFCWQLNNSMGFDFRVNNDIEMKLVKKRRNYYFTVYEYLQPLGSLRHYIYNNQHDGEYLLPEFKHLDFLWLMKDDPVTDSQLQEIITGIRSIRDVQLVIELTHEKIKNKEHLVF